jgi:hypothetical protein
VRGSLRGPRLPPSLRWPSMTPSYHAFSPVQNTVTLVPSSNVSTLSLATCFFAGVLLRSRRAGMAHAFETDRCSRGYFQRRWPQDGLSCVLAAGACACAACSRGSCAVAGCGADPTRGRRYPLQQPPLASINLSPGGPARTSRGSRRWRLNHLSLCRSRPLALFFRPFGIFSHLVTALALRRQSCPRAGASSPI